MSKLARHCAAALLLLSPCCLAAVTQQAESCYRLDLKEPPQWITSGAAWDQENDRLLMVDPVRDQVVSYNLLGDRDTISNLNPDLRPVKIARANEGFLLELADGSMLSLDRRLVPSGRDIAIKQSSSFKETSLYQWAAGAPGSLVAFAGIAHGAVPQYGFFLAQGPSGLQSLLPADDKQKDFFLIGSPYIASIGEEAFFLSMAKHPAIYRVRNSRAEELKNALPTKYATRPDFMTPQMTGPASAVARFAELETFSIPAGLYAQDGYLYLLAREPAVGGATTWWLYKLDPAGAGSILGRVRLPTRANHLTVIPTERGWMVIEKGKVSVDSGKRQAQKIGPVVVISNESLRSLSIPTSCPVGGGILWAEHDAERNRALFIPENLLASKMQLPVDLSSRKHLDIRLKGELGNASACDFLEPSMGQGTLPHALTLKSLVAKSEVAVVGTVESTEPGWDARTRHVVTKVRLKVTQPLRGSLKAKSRIDFLSPGGKMTFAGKSVCTSPRREFYQPKVGDKIVVSAYSSPADSRLLESAYVFPLIDGKTISPEPYPGLRSDQKPLSLSELRPPG